MNRTVWDNGRLLLNFLERYGSLHHMPRELDGLIVLLFEAISKQIRLIGSTGGNRKEFTELIN